MRAYFCTQNGAPNTLGLAEVPETSLGPNHVMIDTHYIGLNFADVMVIAGTHQFPPPFPFIPGFEASGVVRQVGENVLHLSAGDLVMFSDGHGAMSENIIAHKDCVFQIPNGVSMAQAAAFPVAFGTPYFALTRRAPLRHGDTLLVVGAGGNIGSSAVQIGKLLGARVLAIVGTDDLKRAQEIGADVVIDYRTEAVADRVMEETEGKGVNVVFDPVVGPDFENLKGCVSSEGAYLIMGLAGGDLNKIPMISAIEPLQRNISFLSADYDYYLHKDRDAVHRCFDTLMSWSGRGWISPLNLVVSNFENAPEVLAAMAAKTARGKQVLKTRSAD